MGIYHTILCMHGSVLHASATSATTAGHNVVVAREAVVCDGEPALYMINIHEHGIS